MSGENRPLRALKQKWGQSDYKGTRDLHLHGVCKSAKLNQCCSALQKTLTKGLKGGSGRWS